MIKLGKLSLDGRPKVVLVVSDKESTQAIQSAHPDALEIRVDHFRKLNSQYLEDNLKKRVQTRLPLILTIRNQAVEGGILLRRRKISDQLKWDLFKIGMKYVQAVDIELTSPLLKSVIGLAKKKVVIVSSHHFKNTPTLAGLEKILREGKKSGGDIIKIAAHAKNRDDLNRLLEFTIKHKKDKIITLAMGRLGSISRLVFPSVGSLLTYSFLGKPFAPGQIPLKTLQKHFRLYYDGSCDPSSRGTK